MSAIHNLVMKNVAGDLESYVTNEVHKESLRDAINKYDRSGRLPICIAAAMCNSENIRTLAKYGCDPTLIQSPIALGDGVIHTAARIGDVETLKAVISIGVNDVNMKNDYGETPLQLAAMYGHIECCQFLIGIGANVQAKINTYESLLKLINDKGPSLMRWAEQHAHSSDSKVEATKKDKPLLGDVDPMVLAQRLLQLRDQLRDAEVAYYREKGMTTETIREWLTMARDDSYHQNVFSSSERDEAIELLVNNARVLNVIDCMYLFELTNRQQIVDELWAKADDRCRSEFVESIFRMADTTLLEVIMVRRAKELTDRQPPTTLMHEAAALGLTAILTFLVQRSNERDALIDEMDGGHQTPLHLAVANGQIESAKVLLDHGVDILSASMMSINNEQLKKLIDHRSSTDRFYAEYNKFVSLTPRYKGNEKHKEKELMKSVCHFLSECPLITPKRYEDQANVMIKQAVDNGNIAIAKALILFGFPFTDESLGNMRETLGPVANAQRKYRKFKWRQYLNTRDRPRQGNVLTLEGGGIRGLILIRILMHLQSRLDRHLFEYFDFIAGTSTGGIIILGMMNGLSLLDCQKVLFRWKSKILHPDQGVNRAWKMCVRAKHIRQCTKAMCDELIAILGGKTMADLHPSVGHPRVVIPSLDTSIRPYRHYLFRNYTSSCEEDGADCETLTTQVLWQVARATSAAPAYFLRLERQHPTGRRQILQDGGIGANNPLGVCLREFYRTARIEGTSNKLNVVATIGTGMEQDQAVDTPSGSSISEALGVINMMVYAATAMTTETENLKEILMKDGTELYAFTQELEKWVDLNENSDYKLIDLMWNTEVYLLNEKVQWKMDKLAAALQKSQKTL